MSASSMPKTKGPARSSLNLFTGRPTDCGWTVDGEAAAPRAARRTWAMPATREAESFPGGEPVPPGVEPPLPSPASSCCTSGNAARTSEPIRSSREAGRLNASRALRTPVMLGTANVAGIGWDATAVLMAPVAVATAQQLGMSPYPFAMIVALAASAAFMTPISSPVNTLVLGPGQYRFGDFVKVGVPFTILVMIVSVLLVPLVFPL